MTTQTFTFAHLSDPHLSSLHAVRYSQLFSKRILGYLSWLKHRRFEHRPEVLDKLREDLLEQPNDHVLITGDLTHISLPHEFVEARQWLESLGDPTRVSVVPGNHDAYVSLPWQQGWAHWQDYMQSDEMRSDGASAGDQPSENLFPSLRIRGSVALIGVSTAIPTPPLFATGRIGHSQLARLATILQQTKGLFRVVFLHHPPLPGQEKWRKRLVDAQALCDVLTAAGAELVLHGHSHRVMDDTIAIADTVPDTSIPVFGIPSASAVGLKPGHAAQYYRYTLHETGQGWRICLAARQYDTIKQRFVAGREMEISRPPVI